MLKIFYILLLFSFSFSAEINSNLLNDNSSGSRDLPNPMNDRAKGYLLKGEAQTAITNYGNFINWESHPAALWGEYTYLPTLGFTAGVPGHSYSYKYDWYNNDLNSDCPLSNDNYALWCSSEAYQDQGNNIPGLSWYENGDTTYVGVVFETQNDDGILGHEILFPCIFSDINQWCRDHENNRLMITLPQSEEYIVDPNYSNVYGNPYSKQGLGLIYPWAMRPKFTQRLDSYDLYDYGPDQIGWTDDDTYDYYGFNNDCFRCSMDGS